METENLIVNETQLDDQSMPEDGEMMSNGENGENGDEVAENEMTEHGNPPPYMFKVNLDVLADNEQKSFATNPLYCFAAVRNKWSTDQELATFYEKFRSGTLRSAVQNIRENKQDWNRKMRKMNIGHDHSDDSVDKEGCEITEIHRVCKRIIKTENEKDREEFRVHPMFAQEIFSEGSTTVDNFVPPLRNYKRKRTSAESNNEDDDEAKNLKKQLTLQRRKITQLKKKLKEVDEMRDEIAAIDKVIDEIRSEIAEKEHTLKKSIKGQLPDFNKSNISHKKKSVGDTRAARADKSEKPKHASKQSEKQKQRVEYSSSDSESASASEAESDSTRLFSDDTDREERTAKKQRNDKDVEKSSAKKVNTTKNVRKHKEVKELKGLANLVMSDDERNMSEASGKSSSVDRLEEDDIFGDSNADE